MFGYNFAGALVSESGIPSAQATTHARVYVDLSNNHNVGLAMANLQNAQSAITIHACELDGVTPAGTSRDPIQMDPNGYAAAFADQFVTGLPKDFLGVLDISSTTQFIFISSGDASSTTLLFFDETGAPASFTD